MTTQDPERLAERLEDLVSNFTKQSYRETLTEAAAILRTLKPSERGPTNDEIVAEADWAEKFYNATWHGYSSKPAAIAKIHSVLAEFATYVEAEYAQANRPRVEALTGPDREVDLLAECRGCKCTVAGFPYHMGKPAPSGWKSNYYGGWVCSRSCDFRAALELERSMPGHGEEQRSPGCYRGTYLDEKWASQ